jgi:hypothetical protein
MNKEWCFKEIVKREDFEKYSTAQLINKMRELDFFFECGEYTYSSNCPHYKHCKANNQLNILTIYDILKTRPHLPNKIESKKIR